LWGRFIQHRVTIIGIALDSGWIPQWPVGWCRSSGSESEAETAPALSATYAYWNPLNLVREVTYGNGASTFYDYDDAYRVVTIEHRDKDLNTILRLEYTYDARNLPVSIAETDSGGTESLVEFWHDDRGRLIRELRLGRNPYHLKYEYDQGGNRTRKFDIRNNRRVEYDYDVDDPDYYGSRANRLMETTTYDRWNPQQGGDVLSQSWYYYTAGGNVRRVVTLDSAGQILFSPGIDGEEPTIIYSSNCTTEGNVEYTAVRFEYACNASAVTYAAGERWCGDPNNPGAPIEDEEVLWAREFRHDGPWQRYMSRPLSPWHFQNNNVVDTGETMETRYEGNHAFIDLEIGSAVRAFEPGIGRIEPYDPNNWENAMTDYYHTDHNGTVRVITGPNGAPLDLNGSFSGHDMVITAFGEIIVGVSDGSSNRYGFLIPWGFQAHDEMPFLHFGPGYYDARHGWIMPAGLIDWIYTGYWSPPEDVYNAAKDAAGAWMLESSPVRGGYAGAGTNVGSRSPNRGGAIGGGVAWTMDDGGSIYGGVGLAWSRRTTGMNDTKYASNTIVGGIGYSSASGSGLFGDIGSNRNGRGAHIGVGGKTFNLGLNIGIFNCGIIVDLDRLLP
jgi:hypothetical protein